MKLTKLKEFANMSMTFASEHRTSLFCDRRCNRSSCNAQGKYALGGTQMQETR